MSAPIRCWLAQFEDGTVVLTANPVPGFADTPGRRLVPMVEAAELERAVQRIAVLRNVLVNEALDCVERAKGTGSDCCKVAGRADGCECLMRRVLTDTASAAREHDRATFRKALATAFDVLEFWHVNGTEDEWKSMAFRLRTIRDSDVEIDAALGLEGK